MSGAVAWRLSSLTKVDGPDQEMSLMKVKTSIAVEKNLLEAVDKLSGKNKNRSGFIEAAIQAYIVQQTRAEGNARDLELINESADILNQEALDVLDYQVAQ
jgi:metal-responsive CopG/Arc/MetJ family transcriptional regulator